MNGQDSVAVIVGPGQERRKLQLLQPLLQLVERLFQLPAVAGVLVRFGDVEQLFYVVEIGSELAVGFEPLGMNGNFPKNRLGFLVVIPEIRLGGLRLEFVYSF
jgi:hypothetical protein